MTDPGRLQDPSRAARAALRRRRSRQRGVALILVLGALTVLTVMLAELQDETSAELGSAIAERDQLKAEMAAKSAVNLSRLLIASEPTIRKGIAPLFMLMKQGAPQIPVWQFADQVLGAFNDSSGTAAFASLAGVDVAEGKNLGMEGAGFEVEIIDEDSKIDLNPRIDMISKTRLAAQLMGLLAGQQYEPLFSNRDRDEQFSDRQSICAAIIDWADPDQEAFSCDLTGNVAGGGVEDSFYEGLKQPYPRKNAAYDSLEELRQVRGMGDDFWATFVDPDPDKPAKRVMTVWGQGAINVNSANPQTILALVCAYAVPGTPLCNDPLEAMKFLSVMNVIKSFTMGMPLFASPRAFIMALKGAGPFGAVMTALEMKPIALTSETLMQKAVSTESKMFSIYARGYVKTGSRETTTRIHAIVDFRGAPPPGAAPYGLDGTALPGQTPQGPNSTGQVKAGTAGGVDPQLPTGATPDAIAAALKPSAAGNVVYYRYE